MFGDIHKSVYFLSWKEQGSQLTLLAKDFGSLDCFATEFLIDGSTLNLAVSDSDKNVQVILSCNLLCYWFMFSVHSVLFDPSASYLLRNEFLMILNQKFIEGSNYHLLPGLVPVISLLGPFITSV